MGAIIAAIARPVIIWVVQLGVTTAVVSVIERLFEAFVNWVKSTSGADQTDSEAYVTNIFVDALLYIGVGALVLKGKLPISVAKKLGMGNGTPTKVKLSATGETKIKAVSTAQAAVATKSLWKTIAWVGGTIGSLVWLANVPAQIVEPGIYKAKQTNDVYDKFLGIRPFPEPSPLDSPGSFTVAEFDDYARGLETAGIKGIEYGFPKGTILYTKEALAELVDYVTGLENAKGNPTTVAKIKPLLAPYLLGIKESTSAPTVTTTTKTPTVAVPKIQIFSGVLSQGVLGKGLEFQSRPDDMIESPQEIIDAAANNLSPFLSSLAGLVTYQVKIVNSVTTKDGFVQKGSAIQIVNGYNANGTPKYKTIVNKFATLDLFILNDKNTRVKLKTIVLGPVDSVKLQVGNGSLTYIDDSLNKLVTTTSVDAIKGVETTKPVTITTPQNQVEQYHYYIGRYGSYEKLLPSTIAGVDGFTEVTQQDYERAKGIAAAPAGGTTPASFAPTPTPTPSAPNPTPAPVAPVVQVPVAKPGASANTLNEWYIANGQVLPTVQARSLLYQQYGLGNANIYTGTTEQNTKLLMKLKG